MEKPKVSLDKIEQVIDLEDLLGVDLTAYRGLKESIGQAVIDRITTRTEDGIGYSGNKLKGPYSKSYQKSLEFKADGKKADEITMSLTGDMLASMDVDVGDSDSTLTVYLQPDQVPKAYNHITGDTVPKRNWFGVTQKEMQDILADYADDIAAAVTEDEDLNDSEGGQGTLKAIDFMKGFGSDDDGGDDD